LSSGIEKAGNTLTQEGQWQPPKSRRKGALFAESRRNNRLRKKGMGGGGGGGSCCLFNLGGLQKRCGTSKHGTKKKHFGEGSKIFRGIGEREGFQYGSR